MAANIKNILQKKNENLNFHEKDLILSAMKVFTLLY